VGSTTTFPLATFPATVRNGPRKPFAVCFLLIPVLFVRSFWFSVTRRLVLLVGGLGLLAPAVPAQQSGDDRRSPVRTPPDRPRQRFEAANEAYVQNQYERAVNHYQALLDDGYASAALYHNLGNAAVRLDRTGVAVWAYEKARRLRPDDPRLQHNLDYVRRRAGLPQVGLPPRGLPALVAGWSPVFLFGTGLLLLTGGLIGAVLRAGAGRRLAWRAPVAWGPVTAGLLLAATALGTSYVQVYDRRAVVTNGAVALRPSPDSSARADSTLKGGTMVEVQAPQKQWRRVRLGNGTVGWVPASGIREI